MTHHLFAAIALMFLTALPGCQRQEEPAKPEPAAPTVTAPTPATAPPAAAVLPTSAPPAAVPSKPVRPAVVDDESRPAPPLKEDFEGEPKLTLFPRVGNFSPEESDKKGQPLWLTYIDHVLRTSGPIKGKNGTGFAIRSIKSINSIGFFSPLAVEPDTTYRVDFRAWTDLPKGGTAGAGILEFDEFLWFPGQYPKSLSDKHFLHSAMGVTLTGKNSGKVQSFSFRTGPETRMIHLVFFREGTPAKEPLIIDDIEMRRE